MKQYPFCPMLPRLPRCFLRPFVLLGLLLLVGAPFAQAQVVIKERVAINPKVPAEGKDSRADKTAAVTAVASGFTVRSDGDLTIRFVSASQTYQDPAGTPRVTIADSPSPSPRASP